MEGSKVRIIHAGYDRTVPSCRVMPFTDIKEVDDSDVAEVKSSQSDGLGNEDIDMKDIEEERANAEVRPKLYKSIQTDR